MYATWDDFMADVTLLVENCIACVLFIWGTFFLVNVACRYNKHDSELSVVAERIRKEAQDHIILITSQCAFCKVVFSYFVPLTLASGRPEVVAKKFNIKMAKVTLRIAPDLFVLFHGCPRTFFFIFAPHLNVQVAKRSGLRAAATATAAVPMQSVKSAPLRLKFNVSNPTNGALAERRGGAVLAPATRSTSLSSLAHRNTGKGVTSPYWMPETQAANGRPDDERMSSRSLRSRANFSQ
jgi:hypothetical protein